MSVEFLSPAMVFSYKGIMKHNPTGWLNGIFDHGPYIIAHVDYTATLEHNSIDMGVKIFDDFVRNTEGNVIALGHSQVAQTLSTWMRKYRDDLDAPSADRLQFVLTGNPLRPDTGKLVGNFVVGGGFGKATPTDTQWKVVDVARVNDGWAIKGDGWRQRWGMIWDHSRYQDVDLTDEPLFSREIGNTTLLIYP